MSPGMTPFMSAENDWMAVETEFRSLATFTGSAASAFLRTDGTTKAASTASSPTVTTVSIRVKPFRRLAFGLVTRMAQVLLGDRRREIISDDDVARVRFIVSKAAGRVRTDVRARDDVRIAAAIDQLVHELGLRQSKPDDRDADEQRVVHVERSARPRARREIVLCRIVLAVIASHEILDEGGVPGRNAIRRKRAYRSAQIRALPSGNLSTGHAGCAIDEMVRSRGNIRQ